ncbi:MAG: hypothetical protein JW709_07695 [Sedimentisphaerales bacterium]|nr:hypothetical protein [Sedimentisphaerales bacterium]
MLKMQLSVLAALLVLGTLVMPATASEQELRTELQQAQDQIRQLRAELDEVKQLRAELQQLKDQGTSYQAEMAQALKDIPAASEGAESGTLILPAGWSIKPYGYVKLDAIWDDSKGYITDGDLSFWAYPENTTTRADHTFAVTAKQTRLGAIVTAPNIGDAKVRGVIETDFYGTGAQNKAALRMRRAFGEVTGPDWMLLFGQEWEIISPLFPDVFNFSYGGAMGNAGFRQPQIRFDRWWDMDDCQLKAQFAVQREINTQGTIGSYDNGTDGGPSCLARVGFTMPSCMVSGKKMTFGVSGHYGREEVDTDINDRDLDGNYTESRAGQDEKVHTWSINADFAFPIADWLDFNGEMFAAENYDAHEGGVYQGIRQMTNASTAPGRLDEIETMGGWGQFTITPCPEWKFNVGMMVDDPQNAGIDDGMRARNTIYYANGRYFFSKYLWTGLEVMYFDTQYKGARIDDYYDGDNLRLQHSWVLQF